MKLPKLTDEQFGNLLVVPLIIFAIVIVIYPLAYSLRISVTAYNPIQQGSMDIFVGVTNFVNAIKDPHFLHYLQVTLTFVAFTLIFTILISLGSALLLNEAFPGRGILRVIALIPWAVSEYATAIIWKYMYSSEVGFFNGIMFMAGLIDKYINFLTPAAVVPLIALGYAWHFAPLITFFLLAGLQTIPDFYYRAAKIDGAGALRRFIHITLPHIRYALLIGLALTTMEAARATDIILILTSGGPGIASMTLTYRIYTATFKDMTFGYGSALSWILIVIVIVFMVVYFRLLTEKREKE